MSNVRTKLFAALVVLLLAVPATSSAATIISRPSNYLGLVGYWTFDGGDVTDKVYDRSGNGNHGYFQGTFTTVATSSAKVLGKIGQALEFDGDETFVRIASTTNNSVPGAITISAWIKPNASTFSNCGSGCDIISSFNDNPSSIYAQYELYLSGNEIGYGAADPAVAANSAVTTTGPVTQADKWYHIVLTRNNTGGNRSGDTVNIYIDGVAQSSLSTNLGAPPTSNYGNITIARDGDLIDSQFYFPGVIDDVRLYNRELSATEVKHLYSEGSSKSGASSQTLSAGALRNGLVGHWTMDGSDVTDKVYDRSGQAKHGAFVGRATSSAKVLGKIGQALSFNGTSDYVDTYSNAGVTISTPFTISGWFYSAASTNDQVMVGTGIDTNPFDGVWLQWGSSSPCGATNILTFVLVSSGGSTEEGVCGTTTLVQNRWYHITATYDGSQTLAGMKLYLDGTSETIGVTSNTGFGAFTDRPWRIGKDRHTNLTTFYQGKMDDVRVYNRALSATEIKQLYNLGSQKINTTSNIVSASGGLGSGLLGYWTFDGTDVTDKVYDKSGQGNNGYFWNTATTSGKTIGRSGQALKFNGTSNVVYVGDINAMDAQTRITVSAWIKSSSAGANSGNEAHIVDKSDCGGGAGDGPFELVQFPGGNTAAFIVYSAGGNAPSGVGTTNIDDGKWHFILGQYDGTDVSIWVDGARENFFNQPGLTLANTSKPFNIGGYCAGAFASWKGSIDDVRVYNRALAATEIRKLYNLGK